MSGLAVLETHPIQYHAPLYRTIQQEFGIPVTAIYGSDFSLAGYRDAEFRATFAWDTDLLSGYTSIFLSRAGAGAATSPQNVPTRGLNRALRNIAPRVVLLVGYNLRFHQAALYCAWRAGLPILFRGETTDHARSRGRARRVVRDVLLRLMYERCARLLYVGTRSHEHFLRLGCQESKLLFAPYCVDTRPFRWDEVARACLRSSAREALGIERCKNMILFSGKLSGRKGPELVLQAIKLLPQPVREQSVVVFVGSGDLETGLKNLAAELPVVDARFPGFQNQTELSPYFHAADVLVVPSRHSETWGLVVNEALQHGLPCVVSDAVGCHPDLVRPGLTGEVFQTASPASLAAALQRVRQIEGQRTTRDCCRQLAKAYSLDRAAEAIARAYDAVLSAAQPET